MSPASICAHSSAEEPPTHSLTTSVPAGSREARHSTQSVDSEWSVVQLGSCENHVQAALAVLAFVWTQGRSQEMQQDTASPIVACGGRIRNAQENRVVASPLSPSPLQVIGRAPSTSRAWFLSSMRLESNTICVSASEMMGWCAARFTVCALSEDDAHTSEVLLVSQVYRL